MSSKGIPPNIDFVEPEKLSDGYWQAKFNDIPVLTKAESDLYKIEGFLSRYIAGGDSLKELRHISPQQLFLAKSGVSVTNKDISRLLAEVESFQKAFAYLSSHQTLNLKVLNTCYGLLMQDKIQGQAGIRKTRNFVGGNSIEDSEQVPPPPHRLEKLMCDLLGFINNEHLPLEKKISIVDLQFCLIHPYLDGNGRMARLITLWLLQKGKQNIVSPHLIKLKDEKNQLYIDSIRFFAKKSAQSSKFWLEALSWANIQTLSVSNIIRQTESELCNFFSHLSSHKQSSIIELLWDKPIVAPDTLFEHLADNEEEANVLLKALIDKKALHLVSVNDSALALTCPLILSAYRQIEKSILLK